MKFLARLEKKKMCWLLIVFSLIFFFLRLPSLIEPYWYGDEGIYEVVGKSMDQGRVLYKNIWDNKPPLLYVVYALAQGDQPSVKAISLVVGILSIIAFFLLSQQLFKKQLISFVTTFLFMILLGTPLLEANIANAESFILLPIIIAGIIIYKLVLKQKGSSTRSLFIAGLLLGLAFLFKIVAVFDLSAFVLFFLFAQLPEHLSWTIFKKTLISKKILIPLRTIIFGFVLPFLIAVIYFALNNALLGFFQSAFFDNYDYVAWQNGFFGITQGLLILKCIVLIIAIAFVLKKRKKFSTHTLFISLWLTLSLFNAYFSGRTYTHYAIVILPSFCLFIGLLFTHLKAKNKIIVAVATLVLIIALSLQFSFNPIRSCLYYQNVIQFINGQKNVIDYQSFFDQKVPRDYSVATFIRSYTKPTDAVFIWGNNPQIYALADKLPIGKYTVAYHISQISAFKETQKVLIQSKPKYIIVLTESQPLPFAAPLYIMRYTISGATIYERSL